MKKYQKMPFFMKFKFIFFMYWCVLVMQFGLIILEKLPAPKMDDTATASVAEAYVKAIFGKTIETDKETIERFQTLKSMSKAGLWCMIISVLLGMPFIFYWRWVFITKRIRAIKDACLARDDLSDQLKIKRLEYLAEKSSLILCSESTEISNLFQLSNTSILKGLSHVNIHSNNKFLDNEVYNFTNLKRLMFGHLDWIQGLGYVINTLYMKHVLRAVQYLHYHHIYHLNVTPSNILILNTGSGESGYVAKLGGFEFAKKIEGRKIACKEVGLDAFFRPPECLTKDEIDCAKFDSWCVGVSAFEAFTGGLLTVMANSEGTCDKSFVELIKSDSLLDQGYFISALDSAWEMYASVCRMQMILHETTTMYDLDVEEFGPDCWNFVKGLLKFDPEERCTVLATLNTPFMQKMKDPREKRKISRVLKV